MLSPRSDRIGKFTTFRIFLALAGDDRTRGWFHEIADQDVRHAFFEGAYSFYVAPGGAMGGIDRRILEVFYGQRAIDSIRDFRTRDVNGSPLGFPEPQTRLISEAGACLRYTRTDRGSVVCTLYPSRSEGCGPEESFVILQVLNDPRILTGKPALEKNWAFLMSYFECTSVDGFPSVSDRLRTWWLRFSRCMVVNGQTKQRRIVAVTSKIVEWSLMVGLSGALLAAVQVVMKPAHSDPSVTTQPYPALVIDELHVSCHELGGVRIFLPDFLRPYDAQSQCIGAIRGDH